MSDILCGICKSPVGHQYFTDVPKTGGRGFIENMCMACHDVRFGDYAGDLIEPGKSDEAVEAVEGDEICCDVCSEPIEGDWTTVDNFGVLCEPCKSLVVIDGESQFKSKRHLERWMHGLCECSIHSKSGEIIGVATKCRACDGWME